jgi:hypothetical protein
VAVTSSFQINEGGVDRLVSGPGTRAMLTRKLNTGRNAAIVACPVDTGHLRSTIGIEVVTDAEGKPEGHLFARAEYALFVNDGTSRMAGRYFLEAGLAAMHE